MNARIAAIYVANVLIEDKHAAARRHARRERVEDPSSQDQRERRPSLARILAGATRGIRPL
jgi:hypothetical protein